MDLSQLLNKVVQMNKRTLKILFWFWIISWIYLITQLLPERSDLMLIISIIYILLFIAASKIKIKDDD